MLNTGKRGNIWLFLMMLFLTAWIPCFPLLYAQGAVTFGELKYEEELVQIWDGMAASLGMERTDLQNHYTSTYPKPKVIASVKQQTGFSPSGTWSDLAYRNVYCVSHSGEAANNPVSSMVCSSAWYAKQPWTLQNLPDYMRDRAGGDEYLLRFNFLMLAYGADYHAYQSGVNSSSTAGTADYYLCQGICTLTEEAQFTGNYGQDWLAYKAVVMGWAGCFSPNSLGSSQVYKDMNAHAEQVFSTVWHTAKLMAECTQSSEDGFQFIPTIRYGEDGMYHAGFPLTEETRPILMASAIAVEGDWNYQFTNESLDFYSATGEIPASGFLAKIDPQNANGIICSSIGNESVRELHQPVQVRGKWSLTYSQANLVSALLPGTQIVISNQKETSNGAPSFSGSGDVVRYTHTEKWQADYVVNLRKLDAETGRPLEGAQFDVLEAFDASQLDGSILEDDNWDNANGSQFLRWNGWDSPYEESAIDPCPKDQEITDEDGWLTEMESSGAGPLHSNGIRAHHDVKYYSYTKGYCGGHPEPESDGGDGDEDDDGDDEAEEAYEQEIEICEALAAQGGFFHSLEGGEEALLADRDQHYEAFVSLTYEYSARELTARNGYILHNQEIVHEPHENQYEGIHKDTIPIETVTVHSSQYYELEHRNAVVEHEAGEELEAEAVSDILTSVITDAEPDMSESGITELDVENFDVSGAEIVKLDIEKTDMSQLSVMELDTAKSDIADADILDEDAWLEICDEDIDDIAAVLEATASNATLSNATLSNATFSNATLFDSESFASPMASATASDWFVSNATSSDMESQQMLPKKVITLKRKDLFVSDSFKHDTSADMGLVDGIDWQVSKLEPLENSHRNSRDIEADWVFLVYDHRTEGEIHGNKRDLNLNAGESEEYDSYRDTQGDATLEGAVYGLFAAEDIVHPDGKTGVVYQKGNLTSVAATNKNGDFSFTHYTEKPGMTYDYEQGKIVSTGFEGPLNLYRADEKKHSSNEHFFQGERWHYEIQDLEGENGNCWIGRPLILGSYYVQELVRSEGYELSVFGIHENITNHSAWLNQGDIEAKGTVKLTSMEELVLKTDDGISDTVTQLVFESKDTLNGYDIQIKGLDPKTVPSFYTTVQGTKEVYTEWKEPVLSYEPVKAEAGSKVLIGGVGISAKRGDTIELPNGEIITVQETVLEPINSERVKVTGAKGVIPTFDVRYLPELTGIVPANEADFIDACNAAFLEVGLLPVGTEAPYRLITLGNNPALWAEHLYDYMASETCPVFNAAYLETIVYQAGEPYAVLRYSFLKDGEAQSVVYSVSDSAFYVKYDVIYSGNTEGYLYRRFQVDALKPEDYEMGKQLYRWILIDREKTKDEEIALYQNLEELDFVSAQEFVSYWAYGQNDNLRIEDGSIYQKEVISYEEKAGYFEEQTFFETPISFVYYPERNAYECHISPDQIPEDGSLMLSIRYEDIYAGNRTGLSVFAIASADISGTYIQQTPLIYPGQEQVYEDYGTRITPVLVLERVISEKIKILKEIEENGSFVHTAEGFRFKLYLKSNLERLYRNQAGEIVWLNREEEELDAEGIRKELDRYPEKVPVIVTRSTADGSSGVEYVRLLETEKDGYNYKKFFDALAVANHDIWDDKAPEFSSFRPVGNVVNRTEYTLKNIRISDAVRQFAIDWYLKDCVKTASVNAAYSDELYDLALHQACEKAMDYLLPFFTYDLDSIYAVLWDSEENGGADRDASTLAVNRKGEQGYYGVSQYLPYGIYVLVEQQPQYAYLGDLKNKHYEIDEPKELIIPTLKKEYDAQEPYQDIAWSVTESSGAEDEEAYRGYAHRRFYNPIYDRILRIEKLDAVTHENLIHDDAVFHVYKGKRNEDPYGEGEVLFYEEPTMICGSMEFLQAMKAEHIQSMERGQSLHIQTQEALTGPGNLYTGIVKAGIPICEETDLVIENLSTKNLGYVETAQTLEAGVYVICEIKPPKGYVRSDPIALELYSDKITYYKEGKREERVLSAIYEYTEEGKQRKTVRIFVENEPITLITEKRKATGEITYKVDGRIEGSLVQIGNNPDYVYAYEYGEYLGYAWRKGTLEYLQARKAAGEQVEIVYEGKLFAGYGYVTRALEANDEANPYVKNALLTLYKAVELVPSGDTGDYAYEGLIVERNAINDVLRMYVKDTDEDILYYDLNHLSFRKHGDSMYAYRGGIAYLELVGGDLEKAAYDQKNRRILVGSGTKIYHLDRDKNRDALVDSDTGMAYIIPQNSQNSDSVLVWAVNVRKNEFGNIIARDKIGTSRIATAGEKKWGSLEEESGYLTGSWGDKTGTNSHLLTTLFQTASGKNLDGEAITVQNNGSFEKAMNPIYDEYGLASDYPASERGYTLGTALYDRNDDTSRWVESDYLEDYEKNAAVKQENSIVHRLGEAYILENTWVSSERTPNDPFRIEETAGQADYLKRIASGTYIMEELQTPEGYLRALPVGICIYEQKNPQGAVMLDETIKAEISKLDAPKHYEHSVRDMMRGGMVVDKITAGLGEYGHKMVSGVELELVLKQQIYAAWKTGKAPIYLERIAQGTYTLNEISAPDGFVCAEPMTVTITNKPQVQTFVMNNDHTRVEVEKFAWDNRKKKRLTGAKFALYPAIIDASGQVCYEDGKPQFDAEKLVHSWVSHDGQMYRDFIPAFEAMYRSYGCMAGTSVGWTSDGVDYQANFIDAEVSEDNTKYPTTAILTFETAQGKHIRITVYEQQEKRMGTDFVFEYQFEYQKLPKINEYACAWQTLEGIYRMDYLPVNAAYVLTETEAPDGYLRASDVVIRVEHTADIQRYSVENEPKEPTEPEPPSEPEEPTKPESPSEPEEPTKPESPSEPEEPTKPEPPSEPEEPTKPESPSEPEEPTKPAPPSKPDNPNTPDDEEFEAPKQPPKSEAPVDVRKIGYISAVYAPEQIGRWQNANDYQFHWLNYLPHLGDFSKTQPWNMIFVCSILGILLCKKWKKET